MKGLLRPIQKLIYGEAVGDPIFRSSNQGHSITLRPVSGRRAGSISISEHGDQTTLVLETDDLKHLKKAIDRILTTEQRN